MFPVYSLLSVLREEEEALRKVRREMWSSLTAAQKIEVLNNGWPKPLENLNQDYRAVQAQLQTFEDIGIRWTHGGQS